MKPRNEPHREQRDRRAPVPPEPVVSACRNLRPSRGRPRGLPALPLAKRAREVKVDQGQAIDIARFRVWKTGDNRAAKTDRQRFPASAGLRKKRLAYGFTVCSNQESNSSGNPPGSSRKATWYKPPMGLCAKSARCPQSERRPVSVGNRTVDSAGLQSADDPKPTPTLATGELMFRQGAARPITLHCRGAQATRIER
jgi:hypothetical protein